MRRSMTAVGGNDEASSRIPVVEDAEENAPNGLFGRNKRGKPTTDDGRTSTSQSTLNLVNCILGAGVLGFPFCFRSCGLLLGTLIMLVSFTASRFSYNLLLYCSQISNKRTYEDLAEQAVGKVGRQIVQLCTAALNLGCIVAYLNILADVLSAVAGTIIPPGAEPSRNAYITGVSLFGALPVALWVRDHATISTFMLASVGFVILFAVVVVIFSLWPHPATAAAANAVAMWEPEGLLVAFPVIVYSFTAHPYYLGIFNNLHAATFTRMSRVTNVAMGLSGLLYWVVGVFGYLTFRNRTAGDLLRNFGAMNVDGLRGAYERAIKLCYGLSILGSVPLVILPFYSLLLPVLGFNGRGDYALGGGGPIKRTDRAGGPIKGTSSGSTSEVEEPERHGPSFSLGSNSSVGGAAASSRRGGHSKLGRTGSHEVDVVDLKLHADGAEGPEGEELHFGKHALVVMLVLGSSLATAIWVPNIEFIFGLTGATASVLLSYILPAVTFIRLMDLNPELLGGGNFKVIPAAIRSEWIWRKRKAIALLCFGVVSGITCTDAILGAVKQEAAVVHLAQQLVAHEVVVAETAKVQQKARAAVTAMSAVELAAKELGQANVSAAGTFTKLQQAAAQLDAIAGANATGAGHGGKSSHEWGIQTLVKEHKQHVAETKVLKAVELALADVKDEVRRTVAGVSGVISQLDAAIAQLSAGEGGSAATAGAAAAASTAGGNVGDGITTSSTSSTSSLDASSSLLAGSGSAAATAAGSGSGSGSTTLSSHSGAGGGGAGSTSGSSSGAGGGGARDRAGDLALELGKALGMFSDVAGGDVKLAGKSLAQVRSTAVSTLVALNQTATVLDHVSEAVEAAKKSNKHDDEIKKAAVVAMQLALNATATSALAMQLTGEALQRSATEEASELLDMLVKVSQDLSKSSTKAKVAKTKRVDGDGIAAAAATATAGGSTATAATGGTTGASGHDATSGSGSVTEATTSGAADAGRSGGGIGDGGATSGGQATGSGAVDSSVTAGSATGESTTVATVEAPVTAPSAGDRAAEAAGQLEQVIKDLNSKIAAVNSAAATAADTASTAAAAAAAAAAVATAAAAAGGGAAAAGIITGSAASSATGATATTATGGGASGTRTGSAGSAAPLVDASSAAGSSTGAAAADSGAAAAAAAAAAALLANAGNVNSTTAGGTLGGGLNVSGIAAALQDAVAVTKVKQDEALQEIQQSLTSTNAKVAERVVDILKDMSETTKEASAKGTMAGSAGGGTGSGTAVGIEAMLSTAGDDTTAAIMTGGFDAVTAEHDAGGSTSILTTGSSGPRTTSGSSSSTGVDSAGGGGVASTTATAAAALEGALMGLVHKITDTGEQEKPGDVVGPVVKVDAEGHLIQEDGDDVGGPTVTDAEVQTVNSSGASGREDERGDGSAAGMRKHRKLGVGSVLGKPG